MENETKTTTISVEKLVDLLKASGWGIDNYPRIEYDSTLKIPKSITLELYSINHYKLRNRL